ncbi:glycoside hydrolase family 97 protein, partial [candidate division KSB1 bacterium]
EVTVLVKGDTPKEVSTYYKVSYQGKAIIDESRLGIQFKNTPYLGDNVEIYDHRSRHFEETYSMVYGKNKEIESSFTETSVFLQERVEPTRNFNLVFRVFNDGIAFRYILWEEPGFKDFIITSENTEFRFTEDHMAYALFLPGFVSAHEDNYSHVPLSEIKPGSHVYPPLLIEMENGPFVALTEADLTDYAGMYLEGIEDDQFTLQTSLAPLPDGSGDKVKGETPFYTPWRVIMVGDSPGQLIESNIILNLNDPSEIEDESWIKPGKVTWPWWSGRVVEGENFEGGMNTATMKHYIDFASENGLEYLLIDAEWYGKHDDENVDITTPIPEIDMPEIINYAGERDVKILLWLFWKCVDKQMDKAFPLYEEWGISGIKVDYMNRDDQEIVNFYHRCVKKAAEHRLTVNFHGAYKPTGIRRTYPNFITREGVLGLEWSKWSDKCNPDHELIIPFTRMLAGPMDFTPGGFRNVKKDDFEPVFEAASVMGTRCHQLAMYVVYESPLQMLVDYPAAYRDQDGLEFLKSVPAAWDDTKVLNAEIGDYITIARKHGEEWFVGSMTDWTSRTFEIPLVFLGEGEFEAEIYSDGTGPGEASITVNYEKINVVSGMTITAELTSGGGHVMHIYPKR